MKGSNTALGMAKIDFATIAERNRTIDRILAVLYKKNGFLLLGHEIPDEDCISSLVALALILKKLDKDVTVCISDQVPDQLSYLINICTYNQIHLIHECDELEFTPQVICILDTPKPEMIAAPPCVRTILQNRSVPVIEIDHHLSADAACSGDSGYCLVTRASSTCELLAILCCKLAAKPEVAEKHSIEDIFSRNLVLALLTGMIGDTRLGLTLKKNRDIFFYNFFTLHFSNILQNTVRKNSGNYTTLTDIYETLQSLSPSERNLYQKLLDKSHYGMQTGYLFLNEATSAHYMEGIEYPTFVKVIKAVTDFLSEKSGTIGLTVYHDPPHISNLIQFRMRCSRSVTNIDLRKLLQELKISDGGGHMGAIGFRFPNSQTPDLEKYLKDLLKLLETL